MENDNYLQLLPPELVFLLEPFAVYAYMKAGCERLRCPGCWTRKRTADGERKRVDPGERFFSDDHVHAIVCRVLERKLPFPDGGVEPAAPAPQGAPSAADRVPRV
jgi:hypothetical protein